MIESWLDLPTAGMFAVLVAFYAATGTLFVWLTSSSPVHGKFKTFVGVAAPFISTVSVLFSLLTGFLASDISDRNRQAWRAVHSESSATETLHTLSLTAGDDMARIRGPLRVYLQSVLTDDWPRMADGDRAPDTDAAFEALLREVSNPKVAQAAGPAVHAALLNAVIRIRDARADRLALASDRTNDIKWLTVLILGIITQFAIALVHLERPRAHGAGVAVFSLAAIVALGLIALQEHPFNGAIRISPAPLENALATVSRPG
ncbi:DUF4239 domain-containing protein [Blastochloris sulfoviridis]|uniref:DUF4239 domain-containing protein n=1 Tax=Blastochloris sulfoviridis TaxID=50712 RepID=A0A5M6I5K7_9HYPH|nr:DUF4239 domain-containing protein [Blastochloris sulfoviridis]KAA5603048.1 DUF4239 domain-containing protein [Blastochloris sulfoviridis]